jgi:hypothetical protein
MTCVSPRTKQTSLHMLLSLTLLTAGKTVHAVHTSMPMHSTRTRMGPSWVVPCLDRLPFWLKVARPKTSFYPPHSTLEQPATTSDKALRPGEAPTPLEGLRAGGRLLSEPQIASGATPRSRSVTHAHSVLTLRDAAALRNQLAARPRYPLASSGKRSAAQFCHLGRRPGVASSRGPRMGSQVVLHCTAVVALCRA